MSLIVGTNSFISVADASAYFAARLQSDAWNDATNDEREAALQQATRAIERLDPAGWHGTPTGIAGSTAHPLQWPRFDVEDRRQGGDFTSGYFDSATMPTPLQDATCEEALELLHAKGDPGDMAAERDQAKGITAIQMGRGMGSITYGARAVFGGAIRSRQAWQLLQGLRRRTGYQVRGIW